MDSRFMLIIESKFCEMYCFKFDQIQLLKSVRKVSAELLSKYLCQLRLVDNLVHKRTINGKDLREGSFVAA
jgi:hypothetical protein